ncbi:MAG: SRPBCC family protein [Chloroflexota bacterium]
MSKSTITAQPGVPQVQVTREFDAPRDLVFQAWTDPDLVVQWLGPRRLTMTIDRWDFRDGGSYRYLHTDADGTAYGFRGVFHATTSMDGIVQTFEFEGYPGHVSLDTATFEDIGGGRTRVHLNSVFQSLADRDGMIQSGMEGGMNEGFDRLDELLGRLVPVA